VEWVPDSPWRVRIDHASGYAVGAGVLFDGRHVLTCAHVIADALGEQRAERPTAPVSLRLLALDETREAIVLPGGWIPADERDCGDIAVLELLGPQVDGDFTPPFRKAGIGEGRTVRVYGHPSAGKDVGGWAEAQVVGGGGPRLEWLQLDGLRLTGHSVAKGFSGAGVVDRATGAVIGIAVAADPVAERRVSWMIPFEVICGYWPPLANAARVRVATEPGATRTESPPAEPPPAALSLTNADEFVNGVGTIVEILLRLSGVGARNIRDVYFTEMRRRLEHTWTPARHHDAKRDLWLLVSAAFEEPYALLNLADVVAEFHPATPEAADLRAAVDTLVAPPLLTTDERRHLNAILRRCTCAHTWRLHRFAVGPVGPQLDVSPTDLVAIAADLEGYIDRPDGIPPLIAFLSLVELHGEGATGELGQWLTEYLAAVGLDPKPISRLRAAVPEMAIDETGAQCGFSVRLQEDPLQREAYMWSVLRRYPDGSVRLVGQWTSPATISDIEGHVGRIVAAAAAQDDSGLWIQFVLPPTLSNHPVEHWTVDGVTLGTRYPILVGASGRAVRHRQLTRWQLERSQGYESELRWTEGGVTVVAILPGMVDPLEIALLAQTAVATFVLWCRGSCDPEVFAAAIRELVTRGPLTELPKRVLELRRAAAASRSPKTHLGSQIVLLWNDEGIWPPPAILTTPAPGEEGDPQ